MITYEDILHLTAKILYHARHTADGDTYPVVTKEEPGLEWLHRAMSEALRMVFENMPVEVSSQIASATATEINGKITIDTDVLADATDRWVKRTAAKEPS